MHQPIQDRVEEYLNDPGDRKIPPEFHAHLGSCSACATELQAFSVQNQSVRALKSASIAEPVPGFYARVMSRIEEQTPDSFLAAFLEPAFGRRLTFACVTLVLLMGTYLMNTEPGSDLARPTGVVTTSQSSPAEFEDGTVRPRQRDAVLVNLATYQE